MLCKLHELPIKNTLDVMHVECNMFDNVLKYLFGERNMTKVHKDMEEVGVKQHSWSHRDPARGGNILKPQVHVCSHETNNTKFWHLLVKYVHQQGMLLPSRNT
jgi:hypothetical protein